MLRNMLNICLAFGKSEPQYAYKRYAYTKTCITKIYLLPNRKKHLEKLHSAFICYFLEKSNLQIQQFLSSLSIMPCFEDVQPKINQNELCPNFLIVNPIQGGANLHTLT